MSKNPIEGFLAGLEPEPLYTVSEWSDAHRRLSSESSAEPGPWRTSRVPYMKEIMDKMSAFDPTEEVVFMKASQIAATEAGFNAVAYWIDSAPGPIMYVLPTTDMAERNSKTRIKHMIEATPRLKAKVMPEKSRNAGNTTLMKQFPGGVLVLAGANSAPTLSNMPVRYLTK
jgi:phage terminase large subunit GpA-like protein